MKEGSRNSGIFHQGDSMRGTWREGSFTRDPKRYVKALEWASVSIGAPLLRNMEGCSFLRVFEIKRYIK